MRSLSLAIVGINFPNKRGPDRRFEIALCLPGEPVELRLEPKNPADPYAVAVYSCRGVQLGYITAERAPWISAQIRSGRECLAVFQGMTERAGWLRLAFDGEQPTLPVQQRANHSGDDCRYHADPASGFYADPVYDDE